MTAGESPRHLLRKCHPPLGKGGISPPYGVLRQVL